MSQPDSEQPTIKKIWIYLLPLGLFFSLIIVFYIGLGLNPQLLPSALIGQPTPVFTLPKLSNPDEVIKETDLHGKISLLNIWATWCPSCKQEHPVLMKIAKTNAVPIYGLFYKDDPKKGNVWLKDYGNPYQENAVDLDGKVGIEWGTYGTPETFIIDQKGIIQYKHVGPISWNDWQSTLLPMIKSLESDDA